MTRGKLLIGVFVASVAAGAAPALAQSRSAERADPDSRSSGPERSGGTAVDRSSGGSSSGGSTSSPSSASSSPSSGSSSSGSSSPAYTAPSSSSGSSREYVRAPMRPSERVEREQSRSRGEGRERSGGGGIPAGSDRAVRRGDGDSRPPSSGRTGAATASAERGGDNDDSPASRAVPTYSRPRDGRPSRGTAVEREYPYTSGGGGYVNSYYYSPYSYSAYSRYYYSPGYGMGLGYFYDPSWYDPYYYGGVGGGYPGYYGGGYGGGYQGGYGSSSYGRGPSGALRLKIKPRDAEVYVDGFYVGKVDSFDGVFQKLNIDAGGHKIEIKAPGHETISFDVLITPSDTVTYKGDLRQIQ